MYLYVFNVLYLFIRLVYKYIQSVRHNAEDGDK